MRAQDFDVTERIMRGRLPKIMTEPRTEAQVVEMLMPMVAPGIARRCGQRLPSAGRLSEDQLITAGQEHVVELLLPRLTRKDSSGCLHVR